MKNENIVSIICPVIGYDFLIEHADSEVYDLEVRANHVEFDATILGLLSLDYIQGKFLVELSDPLFKKLSWLGMALVRAKDAKNTEYYYNPFDGMRNEALLLIGMDLCEKILTKLNQPDWDSLGFDSDNTLWEYMEDSNGPIDFFQRCKRAIYDRLRVQRYYNTMDMVSAMLQLDLLEFGSWVFREMPSRVVQIPVENRFSLN